jgi:LysM repeat protein
MIETIYSNDNGEANRANKVQSSFKMPKNIRQVGKSNATKKIYVEDYVMTYIKQLSGEDYSGLKVAVLVGQYVKADNCRNIFISGAIEVEAIDTSNEINFSNDIWTAIYDNIKKYFVDTEIVGWFLGGPGYLFDDEDKILKAHIDNFAGQDKTLLTYDNLEKEEAFFVYENSRLTKQEGYYIYYEKNEEMQTYMIDHKEVIRSEEATYEDRVSREIRTVIQNKKPVEEDNHSVTRLMYAAGTLLAVIILVVGAAMLSNYDQMKNMQSTMNYLTRNLEEMQAIFSNDSTEATSTGVTTANSNTGDQENVQSADAEQQDGLDVDIIPGEVKPIDDNQDKNNQPLKEEELASQKDKEDDSEAPKQNADNTKDNSGSQTDTVKNTAESQEKTSFYIVQSGDTLADISYKLYKTYTKVKKIMELNDIVDQDLIYAGQKLIVP